MVFRIAFTPSALEDVAWFRKHEQVIIFDAIEEQLMYQPNIQTGNRKMLRPNQVAEWELRLGKFRMFYDVDSISQVVEIKMIGYKEGSHLYVRGKGYQL